MYIHIYIYTHIYIYRPVCAVPFASRCRDSRPPRPVAGPWIAPVFPDLPTTDHCLGARRGTRGATSATSSLSSRRRTTATAAATRRPSSKWTSTSNTTCEPRPRPALEPPLPVRAEAPRITAIAVDIYLCIYLSISSYLSTRTHTHIHIYLHIFVYLCILFTTDLKKKLVKFSEFGLVLDCTRTSYMAASMYGSYMSPNICIYAYTYSCIYIYIIKIYTYVLIYTNLRTNICLQI